MFLIIFNVDPLLASNILVDSYDLPTGDVMDILGVFLEWLIALFMILGVLAFIVAGIIYITAVGDEGRIKTAKSIMTWAIIGLIVGLSGYIIVNTILVEFLGG